MEQWYPILLITQGYTEALSVTVYTIILTQAHDKSAASLQD